jgi:hypothetical protein
MDWVLQHSEATQGRRLVLIALAEHAHDDGSRAFPKIETLMQRARMSRRGVQEALRRLEADGMIRPTGKVPSGTVVYQLVMGGAVSAPRGADHDVAGAQITTSRGASAAPDPSLTNNVDPSGKEEELEQDQIGLVRARLQRVVDVKGCKLPSREAVATVLEAYPDRDALKVAGELAWWAEHGNGSGSRQVKNLASTFRSFMRQSDPAPASSNGGSSIYDRIEN